MDIREIFNQRCLWDTGLITKPSLVLANSQGSAFLQQIKDQRNKYIYCLCKDLSCNDEVVSIQSSSLAHFGL